MTHARLATGQQDAYSRRAETAPSAGLPTSLPYLGALDGLRCVAVLAVFVHHTRFFLVGDAFPMPSGGFLGVDVFFVVSGFLITALLLVENERQGSISLTGFYWRRAVRLLPALIPVLAVHMVYVNMTDIESGAELGNVATALGFVSNWWRVLGGDVVPGLGHLWSLAVEEQFYLVWPAAVILFIRGRRFAVSAAIVGLAIAASALWRTVLWSRADDWLDVYVRTDARADQLLVGALLAVLWFHGKLPARVPRLAWVGVGFLAIAMIVATPQTPILYNGGFTVVALATAVVLVGCLDRTWVGTTVLNLEPFKTIGRMSYALYLWHEPVLVAVSRQLDGSPIVLQIAAAVALTGLATVGSWYLVERPASKHKHRFGQAGNTPRKLAGARLWAGNGAAHSSGNRAANS